MSYKWCAVPNCTNTTIKTPHKLFLTVPKVVKVRMKWLQLARRDPNEIKTSSVIFFCQDHFNIQDDIANYYQYRMGLSKKIILRAGVVPTKFYCHEDDAKRRKMLQTCASKPAFIKTQKTKLIRGCQDSHLQVLSEAGSSNVEPTASNTIVMQDITMATGMCYLSNYLLKCVLIGIKICFGGLFYITVIQNCIFLYIGR